VFVALMTPVVVLMMFGPFLRWKDDDLVAAARKVAPAFAASVLIGLGSAWAVDHVTWRTVLGMFLLAAVLIAAFSAFDLRSEGTQTHLGARGRVPAPAG
jgi:cytochrome c-type biogenesis protein CcmF